MPNKTENLELLKQREGRTRAHLAIRFWLITALTVIGACLISKTLLANIAINSGLPAPKTFGMQFLPIMGLICVGLVLAAPVWSAIFLTLTSFSRSWRLMVAIVWLATIAAAFARGNVLTQFARATDFGFTRMENLLALPIITLGWCVSFCVMRFFFRWQIRIPDSKPASDPRKLSIISLMFATSLVAISLSILMISRPSQLRLGLGGFVITTVLGFVIVPMIWCLMRTPFYFLVWIAFGLAIFGLAFSAYWANSVSSWWALSYSLCVATFLLTALAPIVGARIYGAELMAN